MSKRKILCIALSICVVLCCTVAVVVFIHAQPNAPIVILYENDVHCAVEGYSKLLAMKKELSGEYDHVGVVSAGDFAQGGTLGAVSEGEYIVELMNLVGYDAIALGNHEFDYDLPQLLRLNEMADTSYLCCNLTKLGEKEPLFDPYTVVSYGNVDIAYIGITTPETLTESNPAQFKDESGEFVYSFHKDDLFETVQESIDAAQRAGADYVIALSHIGYTEAEGVLDVVDIIENTQGLDVVLDAHAHLVIEEMSVTDKSGDEVLVSSTGTKFEYIGKLVITDEGIDTRLIKTEDYEKTDSGVDAYIEQINESYAQLGNRKIGTSTVELITHAPNGDRLIRNAETNLGNFCADALRMVSGTEIAFINGGGIRAPLAVGDVSFNDIYEVFPFNNEITTAMLKGQTLLDLLEMCVMSYPQENGSFPHVSGMKFSVNTQLPSSVKLDSNGNFVKVDGQYRVYGVQLWDSETGTYQPLDTEKEYFLAGINYLLLDHGGGLTMLADATIINDGIMLDVEMLQVYIEDHLGGVIGEDYASVDNRITFTKGKENS